MLPETIIHKYYSNLPELKEILLIHSTKVAQKCLQIAANHPEYNLSIDLLYAGAMLHDIGIFRCHAPKIHCYGEQPYLLHGMIGGKLMREEALVYQKQTDSSTAQLLEQVARICERHTGTGLLKEDFKQLQLPIPSEDLIPETLEEQIICYADKFYSKSHLTQEKSIQETVHTLTKFGSRHQQKFSEWVEMFE